MIKIYVAGKYNAPNIIDALENIRNGQRAATELLLLGYAPFCPFLDYQLFLQLREGESISKETIQAYSLAFLPDCQGMLVLPGWENSAGTISEIGEARRLYLPIFSSNKEVDLYFRGAK